MITYTLTSNVANLVQFSKIMQQGFAGPLSNPLAAALERNGMLYMQYIHERFMSSGGDRKWKPLSKRRIWEKKHSLVLLDTGQLQAAFSPMGHSAQKRVRTKKGMKITIEGGTHRNTTLTLGQLAEIHHTGAGKLPRRPIFVPAPEYLKKQMEVNFRSAFSQAKRQAGLKK